MGSTGFGVHQWCSLSLVTSYLIYADGRLHIPMTHRDDRYFLERECCSMDLSKGVSKHCVVVDLKGFSLFNQPPMKVSKQVLQLLMDRFPDRMVRVRARRRLEIDRP